MPRRPSMTEQDMRLILCAPRELNAATVAELLGLQTWQVHKVRTCGSHQALRVRDEFYREQRDAGRPVFLKD